MLFRVTEINDYSLKFYIIPDDPSDFPLARVENNSFSILVEPTEIITSLISSGRHQTGLCGFQLFLADYNLYNSNFKVYDSKSGLLVFNRVLKDDYFFKKRILLPRLWSNSWDLNQRFIDRFLYHFDFDKDLDSIETLSEILQNHCNSVCVTGHIPVFDMLYNLNDDVVLWTILSDPQDFWLARLNQLSSDSDIFSLSLEDMEALSDPLLKTIINKQDKSLIIDQDFQNAYKILSHSNLITFTEFFDRKLHTQSEVDFPVLFNGLNSHSILTLQNFEPLKPTLLRQDLIFYNSLKNIVQGGLSD